MKFGDDPRLFHDADGSSKGVVTIRGAPQPALSELTNIIYVYDKLARGGGGGGQGGGQGVGRGEDCSNNFPRR